MKASSSNRTIEQLYATLTKAALNEEKDFWGQYDKAQLDCLLHPEKYAPVLRQADCSCKTQTPACQKACLYDAIRRDETGQIYIDPTACTGCQACIDVCHSHALLASRDTPAMLLAIKQHKGPVYAMAAPAFLGQFGKATPGQIRSAFKQLGFAGLVEVAAFADILTMKEALEFDREIHTNEDFMLTSCCCPLWISLIRKVYTTLIPHVPGTVSPMVACGRVIKQLHKDALTVFIGPCLAKKAEAREKDVADAVDFVLTFKEVQDLFDFAKIHPETLPDEQKEHSSAAGRMYAYTGGVSRAVQSSVKKLRPESEIQVSAVQADGIPGCKKLLEQLLNGEIKANFLEGMGCVGGCVGGPRAILDKEQGEKQVEAYTEAAPYKTPMENPYVVELLKRMGFDTVEAFLQQSDLFDRHFS